MCMYRITLLIAWYLPSPGKLPRVSKHLRPLCPAGASPPPAPPLLATFRSLTTEHRGEDRTFPPKFKCRAQERCFWERCTVCWPPGLHSASSHFPIFPSHRHAFSPAFGELVSSPPVSGLLLSPALCFFWALIPVLSLQPDLLLSFLPSSPRQGAKGSRLLVAHGMF